MDNINNQIDELTNKINKINDELESYVSMDGMDDIVAAMTRQLRVLTDKKNDLKRQLQEQCTEEGENSSPFSAIKNTLSNYAADFKKATDSSAPKWLRVLSWTLWALAAAVNLGITLWEYILSSLS